MKSYQVLAGAGLSALLLAAPGISNAAPQIYGERAARADVFRGDRDARMRALVDYLDSGAQYLLQQTNGTVGYNARGQSRALLNDLQRLANDTRSLRGLADNTSRSGSNTLNRQVNTLLQDARNVNSRIRQVPEARSLWDDWAAVADGVKRMQQLAAGYDVSVPQPPREWANRGYDRNQGNYGNGDVNDNNRDRNRDRGYRDDHYAGTRDVGGYRSNPMTGSNLGEFRRLAQDLDVAASRAHDQAESDGLATDQTRERFLENLHRFADDTHALHQQSDNDRLLPSDVGPTVSHLLSDAREVDRSMRQAGAYQDVSNDWQQVMRTLQRMDDLLRG